MTSGDSLILLLYLTLLDLLFRSVSRLFSSSSFCAATFVLVVGLYLIPCASALNHHGHIHSLVTQYSHCKPLARSWRPLL